MTQIKERAMQMLKQLPDEKVVYIVKIIEGLEGLGETAKTTEKQEALKKIQKFRRRLSENFDYESELAESRRERYEDID